MKNNKLALIIGMILLSIGCVFAQEQLTPIGYNANILKYKNTNHVKSAVDISVPIALPFIDDFSSSSVYPNLSNWIDSSAFINTSYPINPPTIGVATLDAIDKYGAHYSIASSSQFRADALTSRLIRLDSTLVGLPAKITPADSLYFSFYFQPQGISTIPDPSDSIVLEFLSFPPDTFYVEADTILNIDADTLLVDKWERIWSHKGISYAEFKTLYGVDFKQVMIPIKDNAYFRKDFQFRFRNYASIANTQQMAWANNSDQWNIDFVYLNKGRNIGDSIYDDVAMTQPQTSILSTYHSMPWSHYLVNPTGEMKSTLTMPYSNLGSDTKNVKREFFVNDLVGSGTPYFHTGGNLNLAPFESLDYSPTLPGSFASNVADSASFEVITSINTTPDFNRNNDSARFLQNFYNYYAYDDGSPENGYGINSVAYAKTAYKFNARKSDTLRGVNIFFNQVYNDANVKPFYLMVWTSLEPEVAVYEELGYVPNYTDSLNEYRMYQLENPIVISGDFYVGVMQTTSDNLNIGFDRNTEIGWNTGSMSNDLLKYNINGTWHNSLYKGALMMRPVFGEKVPYGVGIETANLKTQVSVYPNPANDLLNIESENIDNISIEIYDLSGRSILKEKSSKQVNISALSPGYYILNIYENSELLNKEKLIIIR